MEPREVCVLPKGGLCVAQGRCVCCSFSAIDSRVKMSNLPINVCISLYSYIFLLGNNEEAFQ